MVQYPLAIACVRVPFGGQVHLRSRELTAYSIVSATERLLDPMPSSTAGSTAVSPIATAAQQPPASNADDSGMAPQFRIRSYQAADNKPVCELFAEGMLCYAPPQSEDPWLHEGFHKYVEGCFSGDLGSIESTYMNSGGHFWVVTASTRTQTNEQEDDDKEEEIAAMIALEGKGDGVGELRRLSVKTAYRRHGLGVKLVNYVEQWAKNQGFTSIQLNTDCAMVPALKLYDRLGYTRTHRETIREEPLYYLVWFLKNL